MTLLKNNYPKVYNNRVSERFIATPRCVAKLACEVQKDYTAEMKNLRENQSAARGLPSFITANLLNIESLPVSIKAMLGLAISIGSSDDSCSRFTCGFISDR